MEQNEVNGLDSGVSQGDQRSDAPADSSSLQSPEQTARESTAGAAPEGENAQLENGTVENESNGGLGLDELRLENERLTRELSEAREAGLAGINGGQALDARREVGILQGVVSRQRFERDLAEIKSRFPEEKAGDITELGEQFLRLRAAGVDNLTAYAAVNAAKTSAVKMPETGAVGKPGVPEKEYYSPAEVDRLGKKELGDPKILSRVQKSMTKWRREA